MPGQVSEDTKRSGDHHRWHDCQTIQAVGQVDGVAAANDHEIAEQNEQHRAKGEGYLLYKGHIQRRLLGQGGTEEQHYSRRSADNRLPKILPAGRQAPRVTFHDFAIVINPTDCAEQERHQQGDPDVAVTKIRPEQRTDANGHQDQCATHSRGASFAEMGLRTVISHRLTNLVLAQLADHHGADDQRNQQRGECAQNSTQGQVLKHRQCGEIL